MKKKSELRTTSHSPYQIGRAITNNYKPPGGKSSLNNQSSEKSFNKASVSNNVGGGIDMTKLQQLKAY